MHPNDIIQFRDNVAAPRLMQLFEKTAVPEGVYYIDHLEISLLDGRNCGFDNRVCASGLFMKNGVAEEYSYDECDVDLREFFAGHRDCVFISDGSLCVADELDELDLHTRIRNIGSCGRFFDWFVVPSEMNIEMVSIQYEKLKYLLASKRGKDGPSLKEQIDRASHLAGSDKCSPISLQEVDR